MGGEPPSATRQGRQDGKTGRKGGRASTDVRNNAELSDMSWPRQVGWRKAYLLTTFELVGAVRLNFSSAAISV